MFASGLAFRTILRLLLLLSLLGTGLASLFITHSHFMRFLCILILTATFNCSVTCSVTYIAVLRKRTVIDFFNFELLDIVYKLETLVAYLVKKAYLNHRPRL